MSEVFISSSSSSSSSSFVARTVMGQCPRAQKLVVLVGLPGCGKSTFAKSIIAAGTSYLETETDAYLWDDDCNEPTMEGNCGVDDNHNRWEYVNQDILGSRSKCIKAATRSLQSGCSVIIDRCNFNMEQRRTWVQLARDHCVSCVCIILPSAFDVDFCARRAIRRGADGVHAGNEDWNMICSGMFRDFQYPSDEEGFEAIITCNNAEDLDYARLALLGHDSDCGDEVVDTGFDIAACQAQEVSIMITASATAVIGTES
jgi:predicted kinase